MVDFNVSLGLSHPCLPYSKSRHVFLVSYAMSRCLTFRNNPKCSKAFMGELPCVVAIAPNLCDNYRHMQAALDEQ